MTDKIQKKPYEAPKIVQVVLKHDQAVLSGCSTSTTSTSGGTGAYCKTNLCRRGNTSAADSASAS